MCVFVFRYLFYYYNMYDCEYVLYYFIALHVYEQITIVYSFQKIKKKYIENTLSKNLYTLYHYECFNFKYSAKMDSVLDGVLSRAGQWIYLLFFPNLIYLTVYDFHLFVLIKPF